MSPLNAFPSQAGMMVNLCQWRTLERHHSKRGFPSRPQCAPRLAGLCGHHPCSARLWERRAARSTPTRGSFVAVSLVRHLPVKNFLLQTGGQTRDFPAARWAMAVPSPTRAESQPGREGVQDLFPRKVHFTPSRISPTQPCILQSSAWSSVSLLLAYFLL